jgi:hypothetical protein
VTGIVDFGREALLSRDYLWDFVASRAAVPSESPHLRAACLALLAQRATMLPEDMLQFLTSHNQDVSVLVSALDMRQPVQGSAALWRRCALAAQGALQNHAARLHTRYAEQTIASVYICL